MKKLLMTIAVFCALATAAPVFAFHPPQEKMQDQDKKDEMKKDDMKKNDMKKDKKVQENEEGQKRQDGQERRHEKGSAAGLDSSRSPAPGRLRLQLPV